MNTISPELAPKQIAKHTALFLLTLLTTTIAGMVWQNQTDLANIAAGLPYGLSILFILTCHEFGHYFAARAHRVRTTLPFYIPFPPLPYFLNFGTVGAVIKTRQQIPNRKALFDIGIAGPIAGFIASIFVLAWGFTHLPGREFLLSIHPDYDFALGASANDSGQLLVTFGSNLLYDFMAKVFATPGAYVPPMTEMYHYPFLITGWFGLLITALNLLPVGQLDGGHVSYAMFERGHRFLARTVFVLLIVFGSLGILPALMEFGGFVPQVEFLFGVIPGYSSIFWPGWLFWAAMIAFVIKVEHPPVPVQDRLDSRRYLLGWTAYIMFILSFTAAPVFIG